MLRNANLEQSELAKFIKNKVLTNDSNLFDRIISIREYIEARNEDKNGAFCDYFELGNWFYEAMQACDFDAGDFLDEVEQELEIEYREASKERAEREEDYLRMVGAK